VEPGLEGTTGLAPDLRVDFPLGAVGSLGFGFAGTAAYATFDFEDTDASGYIIDNFTGTFGSAERPLPAPTEVPTLSEWGLVLLALLLAAGSALMLKRRERRPKAA
jgi:hypothetical protein